jgi:hypothetical protein
MSNANTWARRHCLYHAYFGSGILIGFIASSFLWLVSVSKSEIVCATSSQISTFKTTSKEDKGWKEINVFYGDRSHIAYASMIPQEYFGAHQFFSQYRQDEVVIKLLQGKRNGYFVDLASNDAVRISNTYALETHYDWNGLCLEPNPAFWSSLSHRKCNVAAAVVGNANMDEVFFKFPKEKPAKGGIIGDNFDNKLRLSEESHVRFTVRLHDIFKKFRVPKVIDYLSLDVEGAEEFILGGFPFAEYRFNILTVERPSPHLSKVLDSNGYILLKTLKAGKETLWIHESVDTLLDKSALEIDTQNYKYREYGPSDASRVKNPNKAESRNL